MGYYTKFKLKILENEQDLPPNWIKKVTDYYFSYLYNEDSTFCSDEIKWYNHETDILSFSQKYPNVVFQLNGEGEEDGDLWVKYFKNGKMQHENVQITYPSYSAGKLK